MQFDSISEFIAMGGYSAYVWSAFGITALSLAGIAFSARLTRRRLLTEIKNRIAREERVKNAQNLENTL